MLSLICRIKKIKLVKKTTTKKNRLTDIENKLALPVGRGKGEGQYRGRELRSTDHCG